MSLVKFSLLKRRGDIDRESFSRYWSGRHVEVLLAAGHRSYNLDYVQNHFFALEEYGLRDDRFDGAAQLVQRAAEASSRGFQDDPRYVREVRPDELNFLEVESACALFTRAVPLRASAGPGRVKLMTFFGLRRGPAGAGAAEGGPRAVPPPWRSLGQDVPSVSRHVVYLTVAGGIRPFAGGGSDRRGTRFDGVNEVAFEDLDALKRALDRPGLLALLRDPEWVDESTCTFAARPLAVYDDAPRS